jgi:hypothetical protein
MENIIDWFYKPAPVNKTLVPTISKELEQLYYHVYSLETTKKNTMACVFHEVETIRKLCPCLYDELMRLQLDKLLYGVVFTTCDPSLPPMPIHRDYHDQKEVCFGLNIPTKNCHDSFIVWYDADLMFDKELPDYAHGTDLVKFSIPADERTAKEIARMTCDQPYWINNFVPHAVISLHNQTRIMSSIRFISEINTLVANGHFDKFLVTQS